MPPLLSLISDTVSHAPPLSSYEKAQKPLSSYETDVLRYLQLREEVQQEETTTSMRFMRADCGSLKQAS